MRTADALEDLRGGDAIQHRQRIGLRRGRETERDVLEHFDEDAAETERDELAEDRIGDRADDYFLAAGEHLLHLHAEHVRRRVVLLRVGDDRVVALLGVFGALHADQHASRFGLVEDVRRDDLEHDRKAHRRRDLRGVGGRRRHAFLRNGDPVGLAHDFPFRCRERGSSFGFDGVQNTPDVGAVAHLFSLKSFVSDDFFSAQRGDLIRAVAEFSEDLVGVLAEQRRALHVGRTLGHLDRIWCVYFRALAASSPRSALLSSMTYGLWRGIGTSHSGVCKSRRQPAPKIRHHIYEHKD